MGILSRIVMMTKAVSNEVLDKIENPTVMMNQYLRDLDEQITQAEGVVLEKQAQQRILQNKLNDLNGQIAFYAGKAEQAAAEGREVDARAAIEAKFIYQEQAAEITKILQMTEQAVIELEQRVAAMKEERVQLQQKRTELAARIQKANISKGVSWGPHIQGSTAAQGFNRIEQKVLEWEAQQEIARRPFSPMNSNHEAEQAAVRSNYVDQELQRLMQKQNENNTAVANAE